MSVYIEEGAMQMACWCHVVSAQSVTGFGSGVCVTCVNTDQGEGECYF